ncbi:Nucleic acid-binding protein [Corchorus olitorius]|uniref:Nucleic acid-binding protein n=1 Tax=Corchorus olitorius TaxID=93759 RepID=A0A1R3FW43_9ROSI|nr:Nucleic acid-binding protein [Corchorus olitorius]
MELTISQLHRGGNTNYIILRVARRWDTILPTSGKFISVDFLFTDRNGHAIHGYTNPKLHKNHSGVLLEGHVYKISTFQVKGLKGSHNAIPGTNTLLLYWSTTVTPVDVDVTPFPRHYFGFATIEQVLKSSSILRSHKRGNSWKDNDPRQKKAAHFQTANESNIISLLGMDPLEIGTRKYKIKAQITGLDVSSGWFYYGCPACGSSLQSMSTGFYCTTHSYQQPSVIAKLPIHVRDNTAEMKLIIFRPTAEELANISTADVPVLKDSTSIKIPNNAYDIIDKEFYFVLGLPKHSLQREELNFKINDYKSVEARDVSAKQNKGKAIDTTSAPLLLLGDTAEIAIQTPDKLPSAIQLPTKDDSPPKPQELSLDQSQLPQLETQRSTGKRTKPR